MSKKAYILNHNHLGHSIHLHELLSPIFECKIIHNGPPIRDYEKKYPELVNVIECPSGYSHAMDAANADFLNSDATHALYICSDVVLHQKIYAEALFYSMPYKNIGMVSPSIVGKCWEHMQQKEYPFKNREVPFCEGIVFMVEKSIIRDCGTLTPDNIYGWGVDIWLGYLTKKAGMISVVRDNISVIHPSGSSYDTASARSEMIRWIHSKEQGFIDFCKSISLI